MPGKTVVEWQSSYSVGIKLIDEQHMELINLTNKLFASCMAGREKSRITFIETIREAVDYVGYHFGTEEKVMERVNYPEYVKHKKEHADFDGKCFPRLKNSIPARSLPPLHLCTF